MKKLLFPVMLMAGVIFSACDDNDSHRTPCGTPATVRDLTNLDGCGYVFQLEDGTYLQPDFFLYCGTPPLPKEVTEDPLYQFEYIDGKKVLIDYEISFTGPMNTCMAGLHVKITCLTEVGVATEDR